MIQAYFDHIKGVLDQYATTSFVIDANINFENRPGNQGYLKGKITFIDDSALHFSEYLDAIDERVDKMMYRYHYQDVNKQLIFRYDNARHRPLLSTLEHKHTPSQTIENPAPNLDLVLSEIMTLHLFQS